MAAPRTEREMQELLGRLCDERTTPDEVAWLAEMLRRGGRERTCYLEFMAEEAALAAQATFAARSPDLTGSSLVDLELVFGRQAELAIESVSESVAPAVQAQVERAGTLGRLWQAGWQRLHHVTPVSLLISAIYLTLFLALLALWQVPGWQPSPETPGGQTKQYVAHVSRALDATWSDDSGLVEQPVRDLAAGEPLHLDTGWAEIRFYSGAAVLVQGPARLRPQGENRLELLLGSITARVPPAAVGFTVETAEATLVDLGTEFGIRVDGGRQLDVEVFDGRVRLELPGRSQQSDAMELGAGQAARVVAGRLSPTEAGGGTRFVRRMPLMRYGPYARAVLAERPLAYYRFSSLTSEEGDRFSPREVRAGQVAPAPGLNRASGFGGLEEMNHWANFDGGGRSYLTDLKTGWGSEAGTIGYWLRMDGDGHSTQTQLFASGDGTGSFGGAGSGGWIGTFSRLDGSFGISINGVQIESRLGAIEQPAQWNHIFYTWQSGEQPDTSRIAIYLNGNLVAAADDLHWEAFTVGAAGFGKELSGDTRLFKGSADEVAIFERALSAEEVRNLYAAAVTETTASDKPPPPEADLRDSTPVESTKTSS